MKLKKLLAAGLSVALGLSLSAPALASEAADERLTQVTLAVKGTLGIERSTPNFTASLTRRLWAPVGA